MQPTFAGSRSLSVRDERGDTSIPTWILHPTKTRSVPVAFGPYSVDVSADAPIDAGPFPVVVISHGSGSSPLLFRGLAAYLAMNGYVVALPEHPGNNRTHNELADSDVNLVNRPRHISLVIDALAADPELGPHLSADRVGVIGHSMGGYTALAVAGGTPWTRTGQQVEVKADPRVKSLVLLAPAAAWYVPSDSLKNVDLPILMLGGEQDSIAPSWHAHVVLAHVADRSKVSYRVVERAGHYSFFSPFPPAMRGPGLPPSVDPEGFDRERFHEEMKVEVRAFLDRTV